MVNVKLVVVFLIFGLCNHMASGCLWMYIVNRNSSCQGAILSPTQLLTSASCTVGVPATSLTVQASPSNPIMVSSVQQHADFNPSTLENNIAIVSLQNPLNQDETFETVSLGNSLPIVGSPLTFGALTQTVNGTSNIIDELTETVVQVPTTLCNLVYNGNVTSGMFCAQSSATECSNNIGGGNGFITTGGALLGLLSFGNSCNGNPLVYTSIPDFNAWITDNMN